MDMNKLMEMMKAKKQALKQKAKTLKPNPGANRFILLPGWREGDPLTFWHDFGQHFIKDGTDEIKAVFVCADKTFGQPCPVCDGLSKAIHMSSDPDMQELLKKAGAGQSYLLNVLALDSDDDATPQILEVRKQVFIQLLDLMEEWGENMLDPENPQIVIINRDGKGLNTKYTVQISQKRHALPKGVLKKLNNLDDYVRTETEEATRKAVGAINNVAGLLPSKDTPRTLAAPVADEFDDVPASTAAARDAEASRGAADAAAADVALDSELDYLLSDMTGTD